MWVYDTHFQVCVTLHLNDIISYSPSVPCHICRNMEQMWVYDTHFQVCVTLHLNDIISYFPSVTCHICRNIGQMWVYDTHFQVCVTLHLNDIISYFQSVPCHMLQYIATVSVWHIMYHTLAERRWGWISDNTSSHVISQSSEPDGRGVKIDGLFHSASVYATGKF